MTSAQGYYFLDGSSLGILYPTEITTQEHRVLASLLLLLGLGNGLRTLSNLGHELTTSAPIPVKCDHQLVWQLRLFATALLVLISSD